MTFWAYRNESVDRLFETLKGYGYELFVLEGERLRQYKWLSDRIINMFAIHPYRMPELLGKGIVDG